MDDKDTKKVSYAIFLAVISIFAVAMGWIFMTVNNLTAKVDSFNTGLTQLQVQLASIQTDLIWIKLQITQGQLKK